jgi:hypothetical protein
MSARRVRSPGLPMYVKCPKCEGTGLVWRCDSGCTSNGKPGVLAERVGRCCQTADCPESRCFDGDRICARCFDERILPLVKAWGPDYIVTALATRFVDDEAVCEKHAEPKE